LARGVLILIFSTFFLFGGLNLKFWKKNETFIEYLKKNHIDPKSLYEKISPADMQFLAEIQANQPFFESRDKFGLKEAHFPLGEEMEIVLKRVNKNDYIFDIAPLKSKTIKDRVSIKISKNFSKDLFDKIKHPSLALFLKNIFNDVIDFTKLQKGDEITFIYSQKSYYGYPLGEPHIKAALIRHKNRDFLAYKDEDGDFRIWISDKGEIKRVKKELPPFGYPLKNLRVTSKFTYKRWHPILHRYRPHLGVDLGAKSGTPIHAINSGRVVFSGWIRGYGRVIKILHDGGYLSLYAHQSQLLVKKGDWVKKGDVIGKVGSSGISTGSHLHLGLYRFGRAIDPLKTIQKSIKRAKLLASKERAIKLKEELKSPTSTPPKSALAYYLNLKSIRINPPKPFVWDRVALIKSKR